MNKFLLLLSVLFLGSHLFAQEPAAASEKPAVDSAALLDQATTWLGSGDVQFKGRLSTKKTGGFSGGMMMMGGSMGGKTFEGSFIGQLETGRNIWVLSQSELPGFAMQLGEKRLIQMNYDSEPYDLASLVNELEALLDAGRLKKYGKKETWSVAQDVKSGNWILEATLPKKLVPKKSSGMMDMSAKVMSVGVRMEIKADGSVPSIKFTLQKSDPMAAIKRQMESGEGGGMVKMDNLSADDEELEAGDSTVYELRFTQGKAGKRIATFQKFCKTQLDSSGF